MVEHSAVNRVVVGSSPTRGAKETEVSETKVFGVRFFGTKVFKYLVFENKIFGTIFLKSDINTLGLKTKAFETLGLGI